MQVGDIIANTDKAEEKGEKGKEVGKDEEKRQKGEGKKEEDHRQKSQEAKTEENMVAVKEVANDDAAEAQTHKPNPRFPFNATEEGQTDWKNKSFEIFKEKVGEELYVKQRLLEAEDAKGYEGDASFLGGFGDLIQKVKTDSSRSTRRLIKENAEVYPRPVGGCGFAKIPSVPRFPEHQFFQPGRLFQVRLRHINLSEADDASMDGRLVSLRLEDEARASRLDLILYTGTVPPYQNADNFREYVDVCRQGSAGMQTWVYKKPTHYFAQVDMMRRAPDSFYDLRYHSAAVYEYEGINGDVQYARLRLIPADGRPETGLPEHKDQSEIWNTERREEVKLEPDYLRREYRSRLKRTPIQYRLQLQLHPRKAENTLLSPHNPWYRWKDKEYPWHDLAVITITTCITERNIAAIGFNLKQHPATFKLPESRSSKDFFSLGGALREFHGVREGDDPSLYSSEVEKEVKYKVKVLTGKAMNAGTDADVFITMTGDQSRSPTLELNSRFHDNFEAGKEDDFELRCVPVGELVCVDMKLTSLLSRKWYLEEVVVLEEGGGSARFPCYQWLTCGQPPVTLRPANPITPHREISLYPYLQRKYEILGKRHKYKWQKEFGFPGRIRAKSYSDLPEEAKFQMEKDVDITAKYLRTLANSGVGNFLTVLGFWDIIEDNPKLLTKFLKEKAVVKSVISSWKSDEEFGRQILNGPHPNWIRRATDIPDVFTKHTQVITEQLERGISLEEEIMAGHVYYLHYPEMEGLKTGKTYKGKYKRYISNPTCLLYVKENKALVPVAISLGDPELAWTPADKEEDWVFAKMWVREADAQVHQVVSRHLHTHLFMETVALTTTRNLPTAHPVYKLLLPHLRYTVAVNALSRDHMSPADGGLFNKYLAIGRQHQKLLKKAYKTFHIDNLNLPKDVRERGVDDAEALPGYHYREDGLRLWKVMEKFVRTVLMLHYWCDDGVRGDEELQDWIRDLWENGLPVWTGDLSGAEEEDDTESEMSGPSIGLEEINESGEEEKSDNPDSPDAQKTETTKNKKEGKPDKKKGSLFGFLRSKDQKKKTPKDEKQENKTQGQESETKNETKEQPNKMPALKPPWSSPLTGKKSTLKDMAKKYEQEHGVNVANDDQRETNVRMQNFQTEVTSKVKQPYRGNSSPSSTPTTPRSYRRTDSMASNTSVTSSMARSNRRTDSITSYSSVTSSTSRSTNITSYTDTDHDAPQIYFDGDYEDFVDHGVPKYFTGLCDLTEFVTMVMFTASCQHAALTSGSMDYYGYVPNAPTMLLSPPPTVKGQTSWADIKRSLPSKGKTAEIIAAFYTLSRLDQHEVFLGDFPEKFFDDDSMCQTIAAFKEELNVVKKEIEERNKDLNVPYTYLLPDKIPKSVSM